MAFTTAGKNLMLDEFGSVAVLVELMGDEVGGAGPAVAVPDHAAAAQQLAITFDSAAGGEVDLDAGVHPTGIEFEVPGGWTVTAVRYLEALGVTEYSRDVLAVGDQETFANDGYYTVNEALHFISDPV
jgi:hypothetical protein